MYLGNLQATNFRLRENIKNLHLTALHTSCQSVDAWGCAIYRQPSAHETMQTQISIGHDTDIARHASFNRWRKHYGLTSKYLPDGSRAAQPSTIANQVIYPSDWLSISLRG